ncbi:MAG: hypothetical protein AVDCRST_MAG59-5364 [uncultured Thermomicrobiales bacterium]|uniref:Uncharacterized protein n=1 Tax=uncultured Thermomicrobiales bacterium TaxID=1645740 RepID=A0A6J4VRS7_9BACT|nr:MAG: hypothetical protein AVDCRST_MAG59-5364 [uncultured Thermomicrobiales bacterium]
MRAAVALGEADRVTIGVAERFALVAARLCRRVGAGGGPRSSGRRRARRPPRPARKGRSRPFSSPPDSRR